MHELSIAMSILDLAGEEAERRGAGRITAIHLKVGPLSGVVPDALRSAYTLAREATPLVEADLVIEEIAVEAYCEVCRAERPVRSLQSLICSICGTSTPQIVRGRELEVVALEIES